MEAWRMSRSRLLGNENAIPGIEDSVSCVMALADTVGSLVSLEHKE